MGQIIDLAAATAANLLLAERVLALARLQSHAIGRRPERESERRICCFSLSTCKEEEEEEVDYLVKCVSNFSNLDRKLRMQNSSRLQTTDSASAC